MLKLLQPFADTSALVSRSFSFNKAPPQDLEAIQEEGGHMAAWRARDRFWRQKKCQVAAIFCQERRFQPVLKSRNRGLGSGKTEKTREPKFSPYFMTVLDQSRRERKGVNERLQLYSQQIQLEAFKSHSVSAAQYAQSCKGTWDSNQFCSQTRNAGGDSQKKKKDISETRKVIQRSKVSTLDDWKVEIKQQSREKPEDYTAKKMMESQMRSQLDSESLSSTIKHQLQSRASLECTQSQISTNVENRSTPKLPGLSPKTIQLPEECDPEEQNIEILEIELNSLPQDTTKDELRRTLFQNQHVVTLQTEDDVVRGTCSGRGRAQVRCKGKLQSNALLEKLYKRGVKFSVNSKKDSIGNNKHKVNKGLSSNGADQQVLNQFMQRLQKQDDRNQLISKLSGRHSAKPSTKQKVSRSSIGHSLCSLMEMESRVDQHRHSLLQEECGDSKMLSQSSNWYNANNSVMSFDFKKSQSSSFKHSISINSYQMENRPVQRERSQLPIVDSLKTISTQESQMLVSPSIINISSLKEPFKNATNKQGNRPIEEPRLLHSTYSSRLKRTLA